MDEKLAIYCVCFPDHEPLKSQRYQHDIMCNAVSISSEYRAELDKKGFVFDDVGDNISDLNWVLGDLTATYWIWKNSKYDFVGTSQYRRFWDDSVGDIEFCENTLYVQQPVSLGKTIKEQYIQCHGDFGISAIESLSEDKKIPLSKEMLDKTFALDYLHSCNMFIAHKDVYDRFCHVLFEIVFALYDTYADEISKLDAYNKRMPAFMAERIVTLLVVNKDHFFPGLKIAPVKWDRTKKTLMQKLLS